MLCPPIFSRKQVKDRLELQIHRFLPMRKDLTYSRHIHFYCKLKIMGWVVKSTVSVPPHYCRLAEGI